jgi:hypothetical protein
MRSADLLTTQQLSRLLNIDQLTTWDDCDSAAALRHQLAAPLLQDLACMPNFSSRLPLVKTLVENDNTRQGETFLHQLVAAHPVLEALQAIKAFARWMREDEMSPMRGGPATVLYFAAIAAARLRFQTGISQLSDDELREGFEWSLEQEGAESLYDLFQEAIAELL